MIVSGQDLAELVWPDADPGHPGPEVDVGAGYGAQSVHVKDGDHCNGDNNEDVN